MATCGQVSTVLCLGLFLLQGHTLSRGVRAGGSSLASLSGGVRSYRHTGRSGHHYNYYRNSRYYLSYVPVVRRTRSYSRAIMGSVYWSYYTRYHYYSGTTAYADRRIPAHNTTSSVCANYAAGENGTYMGLFVCPLDFEPTTFTACCGDDYEEYCCEPTPDSNSNTAMYIILGVVFIVAMVISAVVRYKRPGKYKRRTGRVISRVGPNVTQPTQQGAHQPVAGLGQYASPSNATQYGQPYIAGAPLHVQAYTPGSPYVAGAPQSNPPPPGYPVNNYNTPGSFQTAYGVPATAPPSYETAVAPNTGFSNPVYGPSAPVKY